MPNPICLISPTGCVVAGLAGSAAGSVAGSAFQAVVDAFAKGLADVMKALMTFWIGSPEPDVSSSSAVISTLDGLTRPLVAFGAVTGLVIGGVRLAWTARAEQSAQAVLRGLLLMTLVTAAGATLVEIALTGFDQLARSILDRGFDGRSVGERLALLGGLPTVGGGLLFILAFFGMLASLVQVGVMLIRGAILAVLVGVLPVAAAAAITDTGYHWFKRLAGWIGSFVVYKLAAAIIYAAAFTMIGDATDLRGVVSGFSLLVVAILALPALLRLLPPAAEAMASGSGGGMGGLVAAGATGAVLLSGTHRTPAPAPTHTPGLAGRSGMTGPTGSERTGAGGGGPLPLPAGGGGPGPAGGPSGSTAAAGGSAGSAASGAAAGAAPGGAVISAAQQAHDSAKRAADGAVGDTGSAS
jgi:type IV secretion system protein TrbL